MFHTIKQGTLEYLTADALEGSVHCFSTRLGGVSEGQLSSLNLGTHRGDKPENVRENYRILGKAVGFAPEEKKSADAQFASRQPGKFKELVFPGLQKGKGVFHIIEKHPAFGCESDASAGPKKQDGVQFLFQIADHRTDSRLGNIELFGGGGNAACLCNLKKVAVKGQIVDHRFSPLKILKDQPSFCAELTVGTPEAPEKPDALFFGGKQR